MSGVQSLADVVFRPYSRATQAVVHKHYQMAGCMLASGDGVGTTDSLPLLPRCFGEPPFGLALLLLLLPAAVGHNTVLPAARRRLGDPPVPDADVGDAAAPAESLPATFSPAAAAAFACAVAGELMPEPNTVAAAGVLPSAAGACAAGAAGLSGCCLTCCCCCCCC
jgi:hypothetical protein